MNSGLPAAKSWGFVVICPRQERDAEQMSMTTVAETRWMSKPQASTKAAGAPNRDLRMWSDKKRKSVALGDAYLRLPKTYRKLGQRIGECAPQILRIGTRGEQPAGLDIKTLFAGTCKARLCPVCATLRARRQYARVVPRFENALITNPGVRAAFATFTIPNVPMDELRSAGSSILTGFRRMTQRRAFKRAVIGWMRAMELTLNRDTMMVHPHLHVVLLLQRGYFAKEHDLYLSQKEWLALWRGVMRDDAIQVVDIRPLRPKKRTGSLASALGECTKYPLKPLSVWTRQPDGSYQVDPVVLEPLHRGLKGKRLFGFGGILRRAGRVVTEEPERDDWQLTEDEIEALAAPEDEEPYFVEAFDWDGRDYDRDGALKGPASLHSRYSIHANHPANPQQGD